MEEQFPAITSEDLDIINELQAAEQAQQQFAAPSLLSQVEESDPLRANYLKDIETRKADLEKLKQRLALLQERPDGLESANLRPLMAFADSLRGTNMAQFYTPPPNVKLQDMNRLQGIIDREGQKIQSDQLGYMNMLSREELRKKLAGLQDDRFGQRMNYLRQRMGLAEDVAANNAAKAIDSDKIIVNLQERRQQLARDVHTLDTADVVTPQVWAEIQKGVANAITGARSATVSDTAAMKIQTLATDWANLKQRLTARPQDIGQPEMKQMMRDLLARLDDAYVQNIQDRTAQKTAGLANLGSQKIRSTVKDRAASMVTKTEKQSSEDAAALEWANANPDDPRAQAIKARLGVK